MEQYEHIGRNIEKDRQNFIDAINTFSIEDLSVEYDEETVVRLNNVLDKTKLFLLGEMHGVKENPDIIYSLFKKFGFRQLGLEWKPELQKVVNNYIESGEFDFGSIQDSPDGRITAGHFALIKKLREDGMLDKLICFDKGFGSDWDKRDVVMADEILSNLSDVPTLVVAGNLHTKIAPISFKDELEEHHPMGENIKMKIPHISTGEVMYMKGQYHNYGVEDFKEIEKSHIPSSAQFFLNEDGLYNFVLPEATPAVVPNPDERLS